MPITGSYRIGCRMFSSCLTCPAVPPSYPVRLPRRAVILSPIAPLPACLPRVLSLPHLPRPASLLVWRDGLAIGVGSVCVYCGHAGVVCMSYGGWLIGSLTPRPSIAPLLDTDGGEGNGGEVVVACFFRISTVCRSR